MISTEDVSLRYGERSLFSDVNITFLPGNCYGLIGANGSGKSTFLKILSGEVEPTTGHITVAQGKRVAVLKQDQFAFDEYTALNAVIMGHKRLHEIITEKDNIYSKAVFSDSDGMRASHLEEEFTELSGWTAEASAAKLLSDLGIPEEFHALEMKQLESGQKVRVLLAQALFHDPDILILDEPTRGIDVGAKVEIYNIINELVDRGVGVIVISSELTEILGICDRILVMHEGRFLGELNVKEATQEKIMYYATGGK